MKKVKSSRAATFVVKWVKHSFSLWISLKRSGQSMDPCATPAITVSAEFIIHGFRDSVPVRKLHACC